MMNELKRLTILEKVVKDNLNKIEEIDICRTQKIDIVEA